jgi:hypothetical protein
MTSPFKHKEVKEELPPPHPAPAPAVGTFSLAAPTGVVPLGQGSEVNYFLAPATEVKAGPGEEEEDEDEAEEKQVKSKAKH